VLQLTRISGRALLLHRELNVRSPDELRDAIKAGRRAGLKGGSKSEEKLLRGIELLDAAGGRVLLNVADETAARVVEVISAVAGCQRCAPASSQRRFAETVGDVDVLAAADDSGPLMTALTGMPEAASVIGSGPTKPSVRTSAGLQVDLRVVPLDSWGAALQYFTGSQAHNVAIREIAVRKKLKLSEYGLFDAATGQKIVSRTEEER
jgi:DNA polymerase (family X)